VLSVDVVSVYGDANAGVRARARSWLRRLGVDHRLTSYFGENAASTSQFLRQPRRAVASERALHRLVRSRSAVLLLSREASPLSAGRIEERLLASSHHGVYDIDDALHHDVRGPAFEALFSKGRKATRAARAADVVVAGNEYLADWVSQLNREVRIVPTCVEPSDYLRKETYEVSDPPRLVWMGTPSGEDYLLTITAALLEVHRRTGARLTIIGAGSRRLGELAAITDRVSWELETVHRTLGTYDLGLMPLRDTDYERGKCAYKLLEYGAAGLPFVGSPVGANAAILKDARAPAPRSVGEWFDVLEDSLLTSASSRQAQAVRQQGVIELGFTFDRWAATWTAAILHRGTVC
jgi:glycosyltransferase involved in cell wall biosynthesis